MFCTKCGTELLETGKCPNCDDVKNTPEQKALNKGGQKQFLVIGAIVLIAVLFAGGIALYFKNLEPIVGTWEVEAIEDDEEIYYQSNMFIEVTRQGDFIFCDESGETILEDKFEWTKNDDEPREGFLFYRVSYEGRYCGTAGVQLESDKLLVVMMIGETYILSCERE